MSFIKDSRLDIYLGEIQADLSQVETLIGEASELLCASFTNVNLMVRVQQKLVTEIALARECGFLSGPGQTQRHIGDESDQAAIDQNLVLPLALAQQSVVADQIEQDVNKIVRALQFQDITAQLLAHAKGRLAALESTLERIGDGSAKSATWCDEETIAEGRGNTRFRAAAVRAEAQIIHFPRSKPVASHQSIETGDIELF